MLTRKKKALILAGMFVLLVATAVLNYFINVKANDGDEDDAIRVFNRMQRCDYFKGKLVAYVMSKLDMLIPNDKKLSSWLFKASGTAF